MWKAAIAAAVLGLLQVSASKATTVTYTFEGTGGVTLNGVTLGDAYSVVFTGDTSLVDSSGSPFIRYDNITGTFTDGAVVETIVATVESNSLLANIDFYNSSFLNGLGLQDSALSGYALDTSIGPISAPPGTLTPTLAGGGFATADGSLQFTGSNSLSFSANVGATPLPAALPLFASGLGGMGVFGWWKKRKDKRKSPAALSAA